VGSWRYKIKSMVGGIIASSDGRTMEHRSFFNLQLPVVYPKRVSWEILDSIGCSELKIPIHYSNGRESDTLVSSVGWGVNWGVNWRCG
jgi:hypothetical protein